MFTITTENDDALLEGTATCFGGPGDRGDNGVGAWGFPYRRFAADLPYCALPLHGSVSSLAHSPLPATLPHYFPVHVYSPETNRAVWCVFVDIGPSGGLNAGDRCIDLGPAAVRALGFAGDPDTWSGHVRVRIPTLAPAVATLKTSP